MQNAVDHAFVADESGVKMGIVHIELERNEHGLGVIVTDDGRGLPEGFDLEKSEGLGTSIMKALITSELGGTISMKNASKTGARVSIKIPLTIQRSGARDE